MSDLIDTKFHAGERAAQARAGVAPRAAAIRDWMPDQHRVFLAGLRNILAASTDADGGAVATMLTGEPGFVASPDPATLRIAARPDRDDPAAAWFQRGAPIGVLGIDLATRRRNRANGVIAATAPNALVAAVRESFGNCPQYIHIRDLRDVSAGPLFAALSASAEPPTSPGLPATRGLPAAPGVPASPEHLDHLDRPARDAIATADTLFVATTGGAEGVDISHRGGKPGFVRVDGDTLTVPDFAGNRYFNTLGNMLLDPRAALLIPDFATGHVLHLQGHTRIVWNVPEDERLAGAERLWRLHVTHAWRRRGALPLRWNLRMLSPGVARTGSW